MGMHTGAEGAESKGFGHMAIQGEYANPQGFVKFLYKTCLRHVWKMCALCSNFQINTLVEVCLGWSQMEQSKLRV